MKLSFRIAPGLPLIAVLMAIVFLCSSADLFGQNNRPMKLRIKDLEDFYEQMDSLRFVQPYDNVVDLEQIVIIRHAEPDLEKLDLYTAAEALQYTIDYDLATVKPFDQAVFHLEAEDITKVYTSNLRRSWATATALFGEEMVLVSSPLFRELERHIPQSEEEEKEAKAKRLQRWQLGARLRYFLGKRYDHIEDWRDAKRRILEAARVLENEAISEGKVVLVAHGLFNRFLANRLRNRGWKRVRKGGNGYLGVTILVRPATRSIFDGFIDHSEDN